MDSSRLIPFAHSVPHSRSDEEYNRFLISMAVHRAASRLREALELVHFAQYEETAPDWPEITHHLVGAVSALTTKDRLAAKAENFMVALKEDVPSLSTQLMSGSIHPAHRRVIFEIALVIAEDARQDILRLIHAIGRHRMPLPDLNPRLQSIIASLASRVDTAVLKAPEPRTEDAAQERKKSNASSRRRAVS